VICGIGLLRKTRLHDGRTSILGPPEMIFRSDRSVPNAMMEK